MIQEKKGTKNDRTSCFVKGSGQDQYDKPAGEEEEKLLYLERILQEHRIHLCVSEKCKGTRKSAGMAAGRSGRRGTVDPDESYDVVAAQASQWKFPPFEAQEVDGYILWTGYGGYKTADSNGADSVSGVKGERNSVKAGCIFSGNLGRRKWKCIWASGFWIMRLQLVKRQKQARELFQGSDVISEGGGFPVVGGKREFYLCESGQKSCGTVEFTVKAKSAKGAFLPAEMVWSERWGLLRTSESRSLTESSGYGKAV